jgi:hypothetical protein
MNWKGYGKKRSWPKVLFWNFRRGIEENHQNFSQSGLSTGRYLNSGLSESEAGMLTTAQRLSILVYDIRPVVKEYKAFFFIISLDFLIVLC